MDALNISALLKKYGAYFLRMYQGKNQILSGELLAVQYAPNRVGKPLLVMHLAHLEDVIIVKDDLPWLKGKVVHILVNPWSFYCLDNPEQRLNIGFRNDRMKIVGILTSRH